MVATEQYTQTIHPPVYCDTLAMWPSPQAQTALCTALDILHSLAQDITDDQARAAKDAILTSITTLSNQHPLHSNTYTQAGFASDGKPVTTPITEQVTANSNARRVLFDLAVGILMLDNTHLTLVYKPQKFDRFISEEAPNLAELSEMIDAFTNAEDHVALATYILGFLTRRYGPIEAKQHLEDYVDLDSSLNKPLPNNLEIFLHFSSPSIIDSLIISCSLLTEYASSVHLIDLTAIGSLQVFAAADIPQRLTLPFVLNRIGVFETQFGLGLAITATTLGHLLMKQRRYDVVLSDSDLQAIISTAQLQNIIPAHIEGLTEGYDLLIFGLLVMKFGIDKANQIINELNVYKPTKYTSTGVHFQGPFAPGAPLPVSKLNLAEFGLGGQKTAELSRIVRTLCGSALALNRLPPTARKRIIYSNFVPAFRELGLNRHEIEKLLTHAGISRWMTTATRPKSYQKDS